MTSCSQEEHDRLKSTPEEFLANTTPIGTMDSEDDAGNPVTIELRNCNRCPGTLARVLP